MANNITNYLGPYLGTVTMFTRFQWGSIHDSTCDIIGQDHAIVAQSKLLNSIKKVTKEEKNHEQNEQINPSRT